MANLFLEDGGLPMSSFYKAVGRVAVDKLKAYHQEGRKGIVCIAMTTAELIKLKDIAEEEKFVTNRSDFTAQLENTRMVIDIDLAILKDKKED